MDFDTGFAIVKVVGYTLVGVFALSTILIPIVGILGFVANNTKKDFLCPHCRGRTTMSLHEIGEADRRSGGFQCSCCGRFARFPQAMREG